MIGLARSQSQEYNTLMATKKPHKKLTLSKDKKLLGVCGGIAEYFNIDASLVRIIVLLLILFSGIVPGVFVYFVVGLFIIPEQGKK